MFDAILFLARLKIFLVLFLLLFSLSAWGSSSKAPRWFEIELVIFENSDSHWMESEQWPDDLEPPVFDHALELAEQEPLVTKRLEGVAKRISRSSKYKLLMHTGWLQSVLSRDDAVGVRLTKTVGDNTLDGIVKISVERYLHVNIDLLYQKETRGLHPLVLQSDTDPFSFSMDFKSYAIKGKRRIRSKELHYFDHPLVAVLVLVTPYEYKDEVEKVQSDTIILPPKVLLESNTLLENSGQIIR